MRRARTCECIAFEEESKDLCCDMQVVNILYIYTILLLKLYIIYIKKKVYIYIIWYETC